MNPELKSEIVSQVNRINSFLERASSMLTLGRQNQEFPRGLEFNEHELKSLDNSLVLLVTKLLRNPDIDENTWMPPVKFAYREGFGKTQWSWLESFFQGLTISKHFITSYMPIDNSSTTYNVNVDNSSGFVIGHGNVHDIIFNEGFGTEDMLKLADELSLLRSEMKNESKSPKDDIAIASIASAEISAREGDKSGVLKHLKSAGKWAFDVATKIGISVAAKTIEGLLKL
jgi:hypothetical protein